MWKSKYKCFIIESRYVCTKDNNLAEGYSSLKSVVQYKEFADEFGRQLKKVIDSLEAFACNRKLLDKKLYTEVRKTLTLCYDTCTLSDADFDNARYMLIDTIYKLQELEELADKASPLTFSKDEGYDPKASYKELGIKATHVTRDMSVGNTYSVDYYTDIDQFGGNEETCINLPRLDGGRVKLVSVTEDAVTLKWGEEEFHVNFGSEVSTKEYLINNPLLSSDLLKLIFFYRKSPNYAELWSMIAKVGCDELEGKEERRALTARKKYILHHIKKAIEHGNTGLYVTDALLSIYNNWGTCEIDNIRFFREKLLKGIERGCLAPDNHYGWEWLEVASRYNDPADFMEDMEMYYEVLDTAAGYGVVEAIDIMDSIWEPEQIIEED